MTYRVRNIVLAIVLAVVAALLTTFYVANYKRSVQQSEASVDILVAARDIPAGTPGAKVASGGYLAKRDVARRNVVPGAISSATQIENLIATQPVYAGEQVSTRRFSPVKQGGIRAKLKGNQRAIQIPGDANQILAGTLKAGDRVDIVAAFEVKLIGERDTEHTVSRTILRNIEVLAISGGADATAKLTAGPASAYWVQLAVTDSQASKLWLAKTTGEWSLDLRPVIDSADSPENIETVRTVIKDGIGPQQLLRAFGTEIQ
jgi:pilus assembly protein CpaB